MGNIIKMLGEDVSRVRDENERARKVLERFGYTQNACWVCNKADPMSKTWHVPKFDAETGVGCSCIQPSAIHWTCVPKQWLTDEGARHAECFKCKQPLSLAAKNKT